MAEGIFRKVAAGTDFEVSSAGVAANPGSAASAETQAVLRDQGVELPGFRSRMVDESMLKEAEAVFCMTDGHREMLEMLYPECEDKSQLACAVELSGKVGVMFPIPSGWAVRLTR